MKKWVVYLINILIPLGIGGLSAYITMQGMESFEAVNKSSLNPPNIVFPIAWTILYTLMGISMAMVYTSAGTITNKSYSIIFYALNLAFNFCWSLIFFNIKAYLLAFIWILILIALVVVMIYYFKKCKPLAAYLQFPYLLWLIFATYLTYSVYVLN